MPEDLGDRTEAPSARRLSEAREQGNIARSPDLSAAVDLFGGFLILLTLGGVLVKSFRAVMERSLNEPALALSFDAIAPLLTFTAWESAKALLPLLALAVIIALAAQIMQVGLNLSTKPLEPKFSRLNPINGVKQLFSARNAVKTLVNTLKLLAVLLVGWLFIRAVIGSFTALPMLASLAGVWAILVAGAKLAAWILAILLLIGVLDWAFQRWKHSRDLRMTKQEVKDERRSMDGDPHVKGQRFRMYQRIVLQRINAVVPKADVVVTNPTHYSVAIKYDAKNMRAPRVVAKGADFLAFQIRKVAIAHGVPIVERPPLARALYAASEPGREISPNFYQAVAEILAYVYRLEKEAAAAA